MKLVELTRPDFPFKDIHTAYIRPALTPPTPTQPAKKPTQEELKNEQAARRFFVILRGIGLLFALLLLFAFSFSVGGFIITGLFAAFVIAPKPVSVTLTAYLTWLLTHFAGVGVFALTAIPAAVAAVLRQDVWLSLIAVCLVLCLVTAAATSLAVRLFGSRRPAALIEEEVELSPAAVVAQKLPAILADYYAPLSEYRRPLPNRREYADEQSWDAAVAEQKAVVEHERLVATEGFVLSVVDDEAEPGAVIVTLAVRDTQDAVAKHADMINGRLDAFGTAVIPNADDEGAGAVRFRVYARPVKTPLAVLSENPVDTEAFFAAHPIDTPDETPVGQSARGASFRVPTHHTCVVGRTGSGKGSFFQTLVLQWLPLVAAGTRRLWLADPKPSEALPYLDEVTQETATTSVFHRIATEDEDIAQLIFDFYAEMNAMKKKGVKRSNTETVEKPGNILMIDEAESLIDSPIWGMKNEDGLTVEKALRGVSRKGRSLNFFLYLFTQSNVGKEIYTLSKNIPVKVTGFVESEFEVTRGLGISSEELKAHVARREVIFPLPKSTKANGYRYAGIFNYLEEGHAEPIRVPFISEEFIASRVREFGLHIPNPAAMSGVAPIATQTAHSEHPPSDSEDADAEAVRLALENLS